MICFSCGKSLEIAKVHFRDSCPKCNRSLHCCVACSHYDPDRANSCRIPEAEHVRDREAQNFCEYFLYANNKTAKQTNSNRFDNLFKD